MYFTSVYHKTSDQWSVTGTGMHFFFFLFELTRGGSRPRRHHRRRDPDALFRTAATYFALQLDYFRMPMADLMLATLHPHLLPYFTFAVYYWYTTLKSLSVSLVVPCVCAVCPCVTDSV
jgi:hypothetical protein